MCSEAGIHLFLMQAVQINCRHRCQHLHCSAWHFRIPRLTFFFSQFRFVRIPVVVGVASLSFASLSCWRRLLVVVVFGLFPLLSASCCRRRRLVVVAVWALAAAVSLIVDASVGLSTLKAHSIIGLSCIHPPWSCNTKRRMVLLRYRVYDSWILSVCHPELLLFIL